MTSRITHPSPLPPNGRGAASGDRLHMSINLADIANNVISMGLQHFNFGRLEGARRDFSLAQSIVIDFKQAFFTVTQSGQQAFFISR